VLKSHKTGYFSPTLRFFQGGENLFGFSSNPGGRKGRACWPSLVGLGNLAAASHRSKIQHSRSFVPTENSIALKKGEQHSRGNEFLGLRKHLSNRRVVNEPPYRLPGQRITAAGSVYILKRKAIAQAARRSYRW